MKRAKQGKRDFLIGVLWGAWFLCSAHDQPSMATELLDGMGSVASLRRLARAEEFVFPRGFWAELKRHRVLRGASR